MSCTFWNIRRRKKAATASNTATKPKAETSVDKSKAEKAGKKGGGKNG